MIAGGGGDFDHTGDATICVQACRHVIAPLVDGRKFSSSTIYQSIAASLCRRNWIDDAGPHAVVSQGVPQGMFPS